MTATLEPPAPTDPQEPRTFVRSLDESEPVGPQERRALTAVTFDERMVRWGSFAAGAAMAWVICFRLLPWGNPIGYLVTAFCCSVVLLTITSHAVAPGPAVADRVMSTMLTTGAAIVGAALVSVVVFVIVRAWPALWHVNLITKDMSGIGPRDPLDHGGILHAIVGTLIQVAIAVVVTVPLALGTAVYMTEVGGRFAQVVRTVVEAMTALPSIVAGLFVYTVLLIGLGVSRSGFAAAMALSVMMLPIVARAADVVLRVAPSGLREASLALGASRWRTVWHVVLPTARPGLATALILGVARGIGETSPVLLTSGASSYLTFQPFGKVMNSLPLFVFTSVRSGEKVLIQRGFAAAAVLLALVLTLFVVARLVARPRKGR